VIKSIFVVFLKMFQWLKHLLIISFFFSAIADLNAQNTANLFKAHDTLTASSKSLHHYFDFLKKKHRIIDNYDQYVILTAEMKNSRRFSEDINIMNNIYLFEADYHSVAQHQGPSLLAVQNIDFTDSKLTMLDKLRAYIFGYGASLELGLYQRCINYASEIENLKIQYPDKADIIDKQTLYFVYEDRVYYAIGDYKTAIDLAKKNYASRIQDPTIDVYYFFNRLNNLGLYFSLDNQIDSALAYYEKANILLDDKRVLIKADDAELKYLKSIISGNIAEAIMMEGRYSEAIPLLLEDIKYSEQIQPNDALKSMYALFNCYAQLKEFEKAEELLQDINRFVIEKNLNITSAIALKFENYKRNYYHFRRNLKMENATLERIIALKNSIQETSKLRQAEALQFAFIFDKKEQEIKLARNQEIELKDKLNTNQNKLTVLIVLASSLGILIVLIVFYIQRKNKTRQQLESLNAIISQKNVAIGESLKQKDILLKEIHHRVKNNLQMVSSLLSLQISKLDNKIAKDALIDGQSRVKAIAMVHQNLYENEDLSQISFYEYIGKLIENLRMTYDCQNIDFKLSTDLHLQIETSVSLGLIITEIVTNSIKHNNREDRLIIGISLIMDEQSNYLLEVSDNGKGFNNEAIDMNKTLGIKLIHLLSQNMKGQVQLSSDKVKTMYQITIPFEMVQ